MTDIPVSARTDQILDELIAILKDMTSDWDLELDGAIVPETRMIRDLEFESIDIVEMVVSIERALGNRNVPFEELLMVDGRYVDDLSVSQVAEFVAQHT